MATMGKTCTAAARSMFSIIFIFVVLALRADAQCPCNASSNLFMQRLFDATGAKWQNPTVSRSANICSWGTTDTIVCNGTALSVLNLQGRGLFGTFTGSSLLSAFRALTGLRVLDLRGNSLSGNITEMNFPTSLTTIRLPSGFFAKSLPESVAVPNLVEWSCDACTGLGGTLPSSWCRAANSYQLQSVALGGTAITGSLPSSWRDCPIGTLDVSNTKLTGGLPASWSSTATMIYLANTNVSGVLPLEWLNASSPLLQFLRLSSMQLGGTFPAAITAPSLLALDVSGNALEGAIPGNWSASLREFLAARNRLTGSLPATLPPSMLTIDLSDNAGISGVIPRGWGGEGLSESDTLPSFFRSVQSLLLGGCSLSGPLPLLWLSSKWMESLQVLNVSGNNLSGSLPSAIGVPFLATLDVGGNQLNGSIPQYLGNTSLVSFSVQSNRLSGSVPQTIPDTLQLLDVSSNRLTGSLKQWIGANATTMANFSHNNISGSMPARWMSMMNTVDVSYNSIVGSVPTNNVIVVLLASFNLLTTFINTTGSCSYSSIDLRSNNLAGALNSAVLLSSLQVLDVSMNAITSIAPTLLSSLPTIKQLLASHNRIATFPVLLPDTITRVDLSFNQLVGTLPGRWTWVYGLSFVNLSYNTMNSPAVPKELCRRLIGPQLLWIPGGAVPFAYPQIKLEMTNGTVKFPKETSYRRLNASDADAWIRAWCRSLSMSQDFSSTLPLTQTKQPPPTPSRSRALLATPTMSLNASMTQSATHRTESLGLTNSRWTPTSSTTPSRSSYVSGSGPINSSTTSVTLAPTGRSATITGGTPTAELTAPVTQTPSLRPTRTAQCTLSQILTLSSSASHSLSPKTNSAARNSTTRDVTSTASIFCGMAIGTLSPTTTTGGLYDVFTKGPLVLTMEWVGGVWGEGLAGIGVLNAVSSWGTVTTSHVTRTGETVVTTLALAAPVVVPSLTTDITVQITASLEWEPMINLECSSPPSTVNVLLTASTPPTPAVVQTAANAIAASVAAPLAGAAASLQVSLLQLQLSFCEFSDSAPLSIAESPTRLEFGAPLGASFRGGIIGNVLLVVAAFGLGAIVAAVHHVTVHTESWFFSQALLRLPGRSFVVFGFLLQPTVSSGVALLRMPSADVGDYVLGVFALLSQVSVVAYVLWRVGTFIWLLKAVEHAPHGVLDLLVGRRSYWLPRSGPSHGPRADNDTTDEAQPPSHHMTRRSWRLFKQFGVKALPHGVDAAVDTDDDDDEDGAHASGRKARIAFLRANRYEYFVGRVVPSRYWYFAVDLSISFTFGIISGQRPSTPDGCFRAQIGLTVVSALQLIIVLVLRPFSSLADVLFVAVIALMSTGAGVCMLLGAPVGSDLLSYVQMCVGFLRALLRLVYVFRNSSWSFDQWGKESRDEELKLRTDGGSGSVDDVSSLMLMPSSFNATTTEGEGDDGASLLIHSLVVGIEEQEAASGDANAVDAPPNQRTQTVRSAMDVGSPRPVRLMSSNEVLEFVLSGRHTVEDVSTPTHFAVRSRLKNAVTLALRHVEENALQRSRSSESTLPLW